MINIIGFGLCGIVLTAWAIEKFNITEWEVWKEKEVLEVVEPSITNRVRPNEFEIFV
ncbi:hypothetical protein C7437_1011006 [Psychrobacillus insolitus]|uniref:Uncharacterized protein n=1 Tax=Psychrobacillus insolitus TaxID=1461 RepID=A0A2W7MRT9_9BACI|nr:hypothetical protein [Psychrobacillus insolitus]PZX07884.1 hypothetical protein C7437_1011006 [Psychrobacillus insolitus]